MTTWGDLFERASHGDGSDGDGDPPTVEAIRERLAERRRRRATRNEEGKQDG